MEAVQFPKAGAMNAMDIQDEIKFETPGFKPVKHVGLLHPNIKTQGLENSNSKEAISNGLPIYKNSDHSSTLLTKNKPRYSSKIPPCTKANRVLVVEDNPLTLAFLEAILDKWGINFSSFNNGKDTLACLEQEVFDLILMDLQLPDISGLNIYRTIKSDVNSVNYNTPVVAISAMSKKEYANEVSATEFSSFLSKPIQPSAIFELINKFLKPTSISQGLYRFSDPFDNKIMQNLYQQDFQHVEIIFDIFLRTIPESINKMNEHLENKNWKALGSELHKIKPSFSMVGLEGVTTLAVGLEQKTNEAVISQNYFTSFRNFQNKVGEAISIVKKEKRKLQTYIK